MMAVPVRPRMQFRRLFASLKFRIVAMAVLTGIVAALGTATIVLDVTQREVQRINTRVDIDASAAVIFRSSSSLSSRFVAVSSAIPSSFLSFSGALRKTSFEAWGAP